eukprot:1153562-Pelagomonas_calceolata.AAC.1
MQQRTGTLELLAGVAMLSWLQHAVNVWGRHSVWTSFTRLHQRRGTPGTRPGIKETAPDLNGRWNRRSNKREHPTKEPHLNTGHTSHSRFCNDSAITTI